MKLENEILYVEMVEHGAELTRIYNKKTGAEILWNADPKFWKRHSPVLFPNVGKTWHNVVKIQGEQYPTSQHGFARDMEFQEIEENHYILKYNEQTLKKYPYKFELHVIYKIVGDALQVTYEVKNIDNKKICFGIGGHPAFKCDYSTGDYEIVFEQNEENIEFLKLRNGLIDTENATNILEENKIHLTENIFDNDAKYKIK